MTGKEFKQVKLAAQQAKVPITVLPIDMNNTKVVVAGRSYSSSVRAISAITTQLLKKSK